MTTQTTKTASLNVRCLCCGSIDGSRRLDLDDLATLTCSECSDEFTVDDLRATVAEATRLLKWIDAAQSIE